MSDNIDVDPELTGKTEWDDILIKHGIKEAPQKQLTEDELTSAIAEAKQLADYEEPHRHLKDKNLDELDELEDDEDERLLESYRQQRLQQLKQHQQAAKYGQLIHVGEADYKTEVTEGSKNQATVIVLLFVFSQPESQLMITLLNQVAAKHPTVKFVRVEAEKAIPGYPQSSCPTILVYRDTHIMKQYVGISEFGGQKSNAQCIEYVLGKDQVLHDVDVSGREDPRLKILGRTKINKPGKGGIRSNHRRSNDSDTDEDTDDD